MVHTDINFCFTSNKLLSSLTDDMFLYRQVHQIQAWWKEGDFKGEEEHLCTRILYNVCVIKIFASIRFSN